MTGRGGILILNDSALSHKLKKMIEWKLMKTSHDLSPMYQERGVYKPLLGASSRLRSSMHAWSEVGLVSNCKGVSRKELSDMSRKELEERITEMMSGTQDFLRLLRA